MTDQEAIEQIARAVTEALTKEKPLVYSVKEAAKVIRLSDRSVYRLMATDPTFPTVRLGHGRLVIHAELLEQWVKDQANTTTTTEESA